jgi:hypothetical protein
MDGGIEGQRSPTWSAPPTATPGAIRNAANGLPSSSTEPGMMAQRNARAPRAHLPLAVPGGAARAPGHEAEGRGG